MTIVNNQSVKRSNSAADYLRAQLATHTAEADKAAETVNTLDIPCKQRAVAHRLEAFHNALANQAQMALDLLTEDKP